MKTPSGPDWTAIAKKSATANSSSVITAGRGLKTKGLKVEMPDVDVVLKYTLKRCSIILCSVQ